jgi:hypothetical protein
MSRLNHAFFQRRQYPRRRGMAEQAGETDIIALQVTLRKKSWKFYLLKYGKNEK